MSRWLVGSLTLAACSAPDSASSSATDGGRVVAVRDLPREHAEVLAAYGRGGEDWERKRRDVLTDPGLTRFLVDNLIVELAHAHSGLASGDPERARRAFHRAENELVRIGPAASPALANVLAVADGVVASLATDVLVRIGRTATPDVLPLLDDEHTDARRRAATTLARMPHAGDFEPHVRAALARRAASDPEWTVRAACVQSLGERGRRDTQTEPWRLALEGRLADEDPAVREAAARALANLGDPRAVAALVHALDVAMRSGDVRVLRAVQSALVALTGESEKLNVAAWRDWWFAHQLEIERGRTFDAPSRAQR